MNEIEKNDEALIEEFNSLFLDTMYKDDGYSEEREVLSNWLRTLIAQKNKEREEAVEAERERIRIIVESMKAEYLWDDDSKKYVANIHRENILNDVLQALNQKQHERNKV